MKKLRKVKIFLSMLLCTIALFGGYSNKVQAKENNFGVTYVNPFNDAQISLDTVNRPSATWDVSTSGTYNFRGSSGGARLYTNYKFKGSDIYGVTVNNTGKNDITVKAKSLTHTYASTTVASGDSIHFEFSGMETTDTFYLVFESNGSYSFYGTIG